MIFKHFYQSVYFEKKEITHLQAHNFQKILPINSGRTKAILSPILSSSNFSFELEMNLQIFGKGGFSHFIQISRTLLLFGFIAGKAAVHEGMCLQTANFANINASC
jgi:hypothetical protein